MNRQLLDYYLGPLRHAKRLSAQCALVRGLMLEEAADDRERLAKVAAALDGTKPIEADTVEWLRRGIRGHYGGEGYVLDVALEEESAFWQGLCARYPENARLCFVAADAMYLAAEYLTDEAMGLFCRAFELDASLTFELEYGTAEAFCASRHRLPYQLALLKAYVARGDSEYVREVVPELRAEFSRDPAALASIDALVFGG